MELPQSLLSMSLPSEESQLDVDSLEPPLLQVSVLPLPMDSVSMKFANVLPDSLEPIARIPLLTCC